MGRWVMGAGEALVAPGREAGRGRHGEDVLAAGSTHRAGGGCGEANPGGDTAGAGGGSSERREARLGEGRVELRGRAGHPGHTPPCGRPAGLGPGGAPHKEMRRGAAQGRGTKTPGRLAARAAVITPAPSPGAARSHRPSAPRARAGPQAAAQSG